MFVIGNPYLRASTVKSYGGGTGLARPPGGGARRSTIPPRKHAVQLTPEGFLGLDGSCVVPTAPILDAESRRFNRQDAAWLATWLFFLAMLALLPPPLALLKQVIILAIRIVQGLETRII